MRSVLPNPPDLILTTGSHAPAQAPNPALIRPTVQASTKLPPYNLQLAVDCSQQHVVTKGYLRRRNASYKPHASLRSNPICRNRGRGLLCIAPCAVLTATASNASRVRAGPLHSACDTNDNTRAATSSPHSIATSTATGRAGRTICCPTPCGPACGTLPSRASQPASL